jgi:hypothetical protein
MPFNEKPFNIINENNKYGLREVGITHPDNDSYFKLADNGDISLMSRDGLGIYISAAQDCIFLIASNVKVLTKEDDGFRWNGLAFNPKAVKYSEPAFVYPKTQITNMYTGISNFVD